MSSSIQSKYDFVAHRQSVQNGNSERAQNTVCDARREKWFSCSRLSSTYYLLLTKRCIGYKWPHDDGELFALWESSEELDGADTDRNKFCITRPLMPLSLHLGPWCHYSLHLISIHRRPICLFRLSSQVFGAPRVLEVLSFITLLHHISCLILPSSSFCSSFPLFLGHCFSQMRHSEGVAEAWRTVICLMNSVHPSFS